MQTSKIFISAQELSDLSFGLGRKIYESGFKPTWILGLWRGGAPITLRVHEYLKYRGITCRHFPLCVESYRGMQQGEVRIFNSEYVMKNLTPDDKILIVDDLFETGRTLAEVRKELSRVVAVENMRSAVIFYKPARNLSSAAPDFYMIETSSWIVFDHELEDLSSDELAKYHPAVKSK